jgi:DNA processing protein
MKNLEDIKPWLQLMAVPGIGPIRYNRLLAHLGSPQRVFETKMEELAELEKIEAGIARAILEFKDPEGFVPRQLEQIVKWGVDVTTRNDAEYPENLKPYSDAPPVLFIKGSLLKNDRKAVAVVGSREASAYGRTVAYGMGRDLGRAGLTVISGMARGIDTAAHQGALSAGGRTIAVLGCGLDFIYPSQNEKLFRQISQQGAVISEYPMGTAPLAGHFPNRNRIITGLSLGVVAVEARTDSGVFSSVRWAADQGREVFAVPGPVNSATSQGTNHLIKQGARLAGSAQDIIEELELEAGTICSCDESNSIQSGKKTADKVRLNEEEEKIFHVLSGAPLHIDALSDNVGSSTKSLLPLLLGMEMRGIVRQLPGKMFIRI